MRNTQRIIIAMIAVPILGVTAFWAGSMIHAEILTARHGYVFEILITENPEIRNSVGDGDLKVLSYSNTSARIYRIWEVQEGHDYSRDVGDRHGGAIFYFSREGGMWQLTGQGTTWSNVGSADGIIWPYFYHSVEGGILFFALMVVFIATIILLSIWLCLFAAKATKRRTK